MGKIGYFKKHFLKTGYEKGRWLALWRWGIISTGYVAEILDEIGVADRKVRF